MTIYTYYKLIKTVKNIVIFTNILDLMQIKIIIVIKLIL